MGYNLKALHYCGTHPETFLKQNCKHCGQGMCSECIEQHPHFCPQCQIELNMKSGARNTRKETIFMTLSGLIALGFFSLYAYFDGTYGSTHPNYSWYLLIAFLVGISLLGTFYIARGQSFMRDIWNIPFFGFKLSLLTVAVIFVSTIPIFYYLYGLVSLVLKREKAY